MCPSSEELHENNVLDLVIISISLSMPRLPSSKNLSAAVGEYKPFKTDRLSNGLVFCALAVAIALTITKTIEIAKEVQKKETNSRVFRVLIFILPSHYGRNGFSTFIIETAVQIKAELN
ncbi:MAG: hypothetical protein QNJ54_16260 [Prochloraceae cyanobacterium]|nr:hypothetical protein [Prochloraceae cyanobacterium]